MYAAAVSTPPTSPSRAAPVRTRRMTPSTAGTSSSAPSNAARLAQRSRARCSLAMVRSPLGSRSSPCKAMTEWAVSAATWSQGATIMAAASPMSRVLAVRANGSGWSRYVSAVMATPRDERDCPPSVASPGAGPRRRYHDTWLRAGTDVPRQQTQGGPCSSSPAADEDADVGLDVVEQFREYGRAELRTTARQ